MRHSVTKLREAIRGVHALSRALFGKWYPFSDHSVSLALLERLRSCTPADPTDEQMSAYRADWVELGKRLAADPGCEPVNLWLVLPSVHPSIGGCGRRGLAGYSRDCEKRPAVTARYPRQREHLLRVM
jgi:hypothetical protein